ncbi:hypothetical protein BASA62_009323 [Batrachochytrium salamandrivorans]|nr:hypothetical protein BASA62_009323 [Batrachochytrium salamandrivorans]
MQFFHLFSFVVVASYAAALPQPAGLSEKYSNSADTNLASGLEARSYQPVVDTLKDSTTLVSLKRRDDSKGSSGENSGSRQPPSSASSPAETADSIFTKDNVSPINLAFTINKFRNDIYVFFKDGQKVGKKIGGRVGKMVAEYIRKSIYMSTALENWVKKSVPDILLAIKSGLGNDQYSKIEPYLTKKLEESEAEFRAWDKTAIKDVSNILKNDGSVIDNVKKVDESFKLVFYRHVTILWELRIQLGRFKDGRPIQAYLAETSRSIGGFLSEQHNLHVKIMKGFETAPLNIDPPNPSKRRMN